MSEKSVNDQLAFKQFMEAVLTPAPEAAPNSASIADAMLAELEILLLAQSQRRQGKSHMATVAEQLAKQGLVIVEVKTVRGEAPQMFIIDEIHEEIYRPQTQWNSLTFDPFKDIPAEKFSAWFEGHVNHTPPFCEPVDAQEPEPRAKNGKLASRKTADAKAKLPFYHKNRRF